jgi:ABC-type branched-subunit amino acid transport system ATPase component
VSGARGAGGEANRQAPGGARGAGGEANRQAPGGARGAGGEANRQAPGGASGPLVAVQDLHRRFGGVHAVNGASFEVPAGRITGLIGPNGAGKTTVLNIVAGALRPSGGTVRYRGRDVTGLPAYKLARRGIIRTFQVSSEFAALTVLENLLVAAQGLRGEGLWQAALGQRYWRPAERAAVQRARQLLARFDMSAKEDEYAGNLSGGQKRLLEIMRGLMAEPALLLLDEPMAGVNPSLARRIEQHLLEECAAGLTMLMIEHELAVVERLCDPVIVMAQGRVISQGTMADIRADQGVLDAYLIG